MIDVKNSFIGGLDLDTDLLALQPNSYVDALNITRDAVTANRDFAASNIVGNRKVNYSLPPGINQVIGAKEDTVRNRVIYFVWNQFGKHSILNYNNSTRTIAKVLENLTDTAFIDILEFSRTKKIIHIEIVHRDEGDLLYWTDGNVSPKGCILNKLQNGDYGTVELDFIEAAKSPPLTPAIVSYRDDSNRSTNSLRRKLYQLRYRWKYDDNSKSTWSPWSKTPLPVGMVGTDTDLDATKNNFIATTITTGNKNVTDVEVAFREFSGNTWGDPLLTVSLNKEQLSIADNTEYQYNFYNDNTPLPLDVRESNLLFDWFPRLAKSMCLANGNVLVYGAITEGYDLVPQDELNVEMTVTRIKNTGVEQGDPSLTYIQDNLNFLFTVGQNVPTGTYYRVIAFIGGTPPVGPITLCDYTALAGNTANDVALALFNDMPATYQLAQGANTFTANLPSGSYIIQVQVTPGTGSTSIASATGWPWYSRYRFGLVYFDEKGRTNGVHTYVNQPADGNDFEIETGAFELDAGIPKTAVIDAEINHLPPSWAVKYCWVRSNNLTFERQLYYVTCDFQSDADYYYFGLQNIKYYYDKNNKFIYSDIASYVRDGDRIRVAASASGGGYTGNIWDQDYEILGVVNRVITSGSEEGAYVKVKKPVSAPSPPYSINMLVIVYTPITSSPDESKTVYWEFSQFYDIYTLGGVNYHRGELQDQTGSQPATFRFTNGDYYYRSRNMFHDLVPPENSVNLLLFDANYSDFFPSAVNSNGRPEVVEVNAAQTYYPATVRFGQEFQQNTTINELPRFYPGNVKDYTRTYGSILKLIIRDQYMKVGQELKVGAVPVNLQIVKTLDENGVLTASDQLLNNINYYSGEFGVGGCPEAWASFNFADYFVDNQRGSILRLSQDGITVLSVLYRVNSWASEELPLRDGTNTFIYGAFDKKLNNYIIAVEAAGVSEAQTLAFDEETNAFESFLSYKPEMMCTFGNLLITFKDGELWTHDSGTYNQFYGASYESYIVPVFSIPGLIKKTWSSINMVSDGIWDAPLIYSNVNTYGTQRQETNLVAAEFLVLEGNSTAPIKRDVYSPGGKVNGQFMKGNWLAVKLRKQNANSLVFLSLVSARFSESPMTAT
jgi:hypothetical protein